MRPIYLDFSSTTPLLPPVWEAMLPYLTEHFGNPSSSHRHGRASRRALDDGRQTISQCLDCAPEEILFTSGATEANNLAIFGLAVQGGTIMSSPLEHSCVTGPVLELKRRGVHVSELHLSPAGVAELPAAFPADLKLAILMLANHEIGTVQPVRELATQAPVHCDAAAAVGKMPISFRDLAVSSLSFSAHKFHGPVGIGALIVKTGVRLQPMLWGGHQQQGKRPGTEPVALVVGMARALQIATDRLREHRRHVAAVRTRFLEKLRPANPVINGALDRSLPFVLNVSFPGCKADALLMKLDLAGVACSTGSACSSGSLLPSPVVAALGVAPEVLQSAMRFSFSHLTTSEDVDEAAERIVQSVHDLRRADSLDS